MVNISDSGSPNVPQEMEQFLSNDGVEGIKYKIQPRSDARMEAGSNGYDPFAERNNPSPTTDWETFAHLMKAALGTGILGMPFAFKYSGIMLGVFATIFTALICTHCAYVLVKCAHVLYYRTRRPTMSFAEIAVSAFENGPKWCRGFAPFANMLILVALFLTYFGTCSVYTVIVAKNIQIVLPMAVSLRVLIAILLIPLILLTYIPNLKYLAPVSALANLLMGAGLGITIYYLVQDLPPIEEREYQNFMKLPPFFAICIFAMEAIGVVMPLENNMRTPRNFLGIFGVLNRGMFFVTFIYMALGFLGYWKFGDSTADSITLNLPKEEILAKIVNVVIALAVFCTFGLQFFVCLEIIWTPLQKHFKKRPIIGNYMCRTLLVVAAVVLALAVPTIGPFMGLIGAFCFSILGLIFPAVIELIVFCDEGFQGLKWIILKNIFVFAFGIFALIFGTMSAITDIVEQYK